MGTLRWVHEDARPCCFAGAHMLELVWAVRYPMPIPTIPPASECPNRWLSLDRLMLVRRMRVLCSGVVEFRREVEKCR